MCSGVPFEECGEFGVVKEEVKIGSVLFVDELVQGLDVIEVCLSHEEIVD